VKDVVETLQGTGERLDDFLGKVYELLQSSKEVGGIPPYSASGIEEELTAANTVHEFGAGFLHKQGDEIDETDLERDEIDDDDVHGGKKKSKKSKKSGKSRKSKKTFENFVALIYYFPKGA